MKLMVVCEAPADFRIVSELIDRVLREQGPQWIADVLEANPDGIRSWLPDGKGHLFFRVHELVEYCRKHGVRRYPGHFADKPGAASAKMARTAFQLARELNQQGASIDAVLLVGDTDGEAKERKAGLDQAREQAEQLNPFRIILGSPDAMREAWVLSGFEPKTDEEESILQALRSELGFSPVDQSHQLDSSDEQSKRSAKRVLNKLTDGDKGREEPCWQETPLETLKAHGASNGLADFLQEVEEHLLPLATAKPTTP